MRLLVTGGGGQVGSALAYMAACRNFTVLATTHDELDITLPQDVNEMVGHFQPDAIINCAAYTAVDKAESDEAAAFAVNGHGPGLLAASASEAGVPMIHISTDYVFDGRKDSPYSEDDETGPIGAYGRSKLAGERAVRAACDRHVILRTAWVYGVRGANFVKTMLRVGAERPELAVVGDQVGSPSCTVDIAMAILDVVSNLAARPDDTDVYGTFHCSGDGSTSWYGFACKIFDLAAPHLASRPNVREITTADYPTPARRPANSRLSSEKLKSVHGVTMRPWEDALAAMLATHFAEHPGGTSA